MQQINLYLDEFRPKIDWFSAEKSVAYLSAIFIVLVGFYAVALIDQVNLEKSIVALEAEKKQLEEAVKKIESLPKPPSGTALEEKIRLAKEGLKNRENIANIMAGESLGNQEGFYQPIKALGDQLQKNMSLEFFKFSKGGRVLSMVGRTEKAHLVPLYIKNLQAHESLQGTTFGYMVVQRDNANLRFELTGEGAVPVELLAEQPNLVLMQ